MDAIEDARDALDPPSALIALIAEQTKRALQAEQESNKEASSRVANAWIDDLTVELTGMPVRDLRQRASEGGADADAIEEARDALDPPSALIALIVEAEKARRASSRLGDALEGLELELAAMTVKQLRQRAAEIGVAENAIEDARDGLDPPAELRALIVQRWVLEDDP
eukprot:COSAG02_NODE_11313_length_1749_cov_1.886061_2_plen_168_part_00